MPHTYTDLHVHVVFGTLGRRPFLTDSIRSQVFSCLRSLATELNLHPIRIGGWVDHAHVLAGFSPRAALADAIRDLKSRSSGWVRDTANAEFRWQRGYAAFSVSRGGCPRLQRYIANQEEHHRRESFEDEYRRLLQECGIEVDPAFLWT